MDEIINSNERDSQIAALNHEIYELTKRLDEQEKRHILSITTDKNDPFDNPTDYKHFGGDYSKILPRLGEPGFVIPLEPEYGERKALRRYYSVGGWCTLAHFFFTMAFALLFIRLVAFILHMVNPLTDAASLSMYIRGSSILVSINMLTYMIFNVVLGLIGMKWADIKPRSLIRTRDFTFGKASQYCIIGIFIWIVSIYLSTGVSDIFSKYGVDVISHSSGTGETFMGKAVSTLYGCIIAPITEEFFYRGMVLRTFSKANQRFAVFASAFFFGVAHGNIPQFILGFLTGLFLAHITLKHGSIIPSAIVHIFINSFSTVFGELTDVSVNMRIIITLVLFSTAILGMILLLVFTGRDRIPSPTPHQCKRGFYVASSSIPLCASFILYTFYLVYKLFT